MFTIYSKYIYEICLGETTKWILVLYIISQNHYVGVPVYCDEKIGSIYLKSINRYLLLSEIRDYSRSSIRKCIYIKGKPLKITNKEFDEILIKSKKYFVDYVNDNTNNDLDGICYSKWCKDKLDLINNKNSSITNLKIGAICWVDLGYNVGNELRKLRPAILWRSTSDKKMWTIIPLTSKRKNDNYYFHYDLEDGKLGTARIESLINISLNRIREPYFYKNKIATITKKDNDQIIKIIKKYYAFANTKIIKNIISDKTTQSLSNECKEIFEKVLT